MELSCLRGTQNFLEAVMLMTRACYSGGKMLMFRLRHGKTFSCESPGNC